MERIYDWKATRSGVGQVINGYTRPFGKGGAQRNPRRLTNVVEIRAPRAGEGPWPIATDGNGTEYVLECGA